MISTKFFEKGELFKHSNLSDIQCLNHKCEWQLPVNSIPVLSAMSIEISGPTLLSIIDKFKTLYDSNYNYEILSRSNFATSYKYLPDNINFDPIVCLPSNSHKIYFIEFAMARSKSRFKENRDIPWIHILFGSNVTKSKELVDLVKTYEILEI